LPFCSPWRFAQAKRERHARGYSSPGRKQMSRRGSPGRLAASACLYRADMYSQGISQHYQPWPRTAHLPWYNCRVGVFPAALARQPVSLCVRSAFCVSAFPRYLCASPQLVRSPLGPRSAPAGCLLFLRPDHWRRSGVESTGFSDGLAG
jgi:hypothetical protein